MFFLARQLVGWIDHRRREPILRSIQPKIALTFNSPNGEKGEIMKVYNLTAHPISIIAEADCHSSPAIRKLVADANVKPVMVIPSYGMVSAKTETHEAEPIEGIPVFEKKITGIDPLPEESPDNIYIVSAMYVSAYRALYPNSNIPLYTVADLVYTEDGRTILGSRGIMLAL